MTKFWLSLCMLLGLACTPLAHATIYYVSNATGVDITPCSKATSTTGSNPMRTITYTINTCTSPGDTIQVRAGNYDEVLGNAIASVNWPVGSSWNAGGYLLLEGYPGDALPTVIGFDFHRNNDASNGQAPQYIWINRFDVNRRGVGNSSSAWTENALYYTMPHLKVTNSKFHNTNNMGLAGGGRGAGDFTTDFTFDRNEVYDVWVFADPAGPSFSGCPSSGTCADGGYGMYISPANSTLSNNYFHDIAGYALHFYHFDGNQVMFNNKIFNNVFTRTNNNDGQRNHGLGTMVLYGTGSQVYNNVIYDTGLGYANSISAIQFDSNDNVAYNNTMVNVNGWGVYFEAGGNNIVRGNIVYQASRGPTANASGQSNTFDSTNFTTNPAVDSTYHLTSGSPARGACPNLFGAGVTVDMDNEARPSPPTSFDCGADQIVVVITPTKSQLEFGIQPSDSLSTATITPLVTVRVEASDGQLITDATDAMTLSLVSTQIPRASLSVVSTDSAQAGWPGTNAIDGDNTTAWHTDFSGTPGQNHNIVLSFPSSTVNGLVYTPRLGPDTSGQIVGYNVYVSADCATWGTAVATGNFGLQAGGKRYGISTIPKVGTCLKFESTSAKSGQPYSSAAELSVLAASSVVPTGTLTQAAVGGIATFTLAVPTAGTAYVLKATAGTLNPQLSAPFTITDAGGGPPPGIEPATLLKYVPGR